MSDMAQRRTGSYVLTIGNIGVLVCTFCLGACLTSKPPQQYQGRSPLVISGSYHRSYNSIGTSTPRYTPHAYEQLPISTSTLLPTTWPERLSPIHSMPTLNSQSNRPPPHHAFLSSPTPSSRLAPLDYGCMHTDAAPLPYSAYAERHRPGPSGAPTSTSASPPPPQAPPPPPAPAIERPAVREDRRIYAVFRLMKSHRRLSVGRGMVVDVQKLSRCRRLRAEVFVTCFPSLLRPSPCVSHIPLYAVYEELPGRPCRI